MLQLKLYILHFHKVHVFHTYILAFWISYSTNTIPCENKYWHSDLGSSRCAPVVVWIQPYQRTRRSTVYSKSISLSAWFAVMLWLWQSHKGEWYGPPSVPSVCDQTCRQNSSACFAAMLWQNHKGGWYGPPTATSSITVPLLPLYAVTTPQRCMIRPTYIANECIMTMWRFAAPSRLFILEPPPRGLWQHASVWYGPPSVSSVCDQTCRQNSSACFAAVLWQNRKGGW